MKHATRSAGHQATTGYARAASAQWYARVSRPWSVGCPATILMTAKPGIGAFADHANLTTRRLKESSH